MVALLALGFGTGSTWMVVVGVVVSAILIALGFVARKAVPRERITSAAELVSSIAAFAASPGSRFLHVTVYRDGAIFASRRIQGGKIPDVTRYALTGVPCPHCVIEQQTQVNPR